MDHEHGLSITSTNTREGSSRRRQEADSVVMDNVTIHPLTGGGYVSCGR